MNDYSGEVLPVNSWRFPYQARVVGSIIVVFACIEFAQVAVFWVRIVGVLLALFWVPVAMLNLEKAKQEKVEWLPGAYILWAFLLIFSLFLLMMIPGLIRNSVGKFPFLGPYWLLFGLWFFFWANRMTSVDSAISRSELKPGRSAFLSVIVALILTVALPFITGSSLDGLIRAAANGKTDRFPGLLDRVKKEIPAYPVENALCRAIDERQAGLTEWLLTQKPDVNQIAGNYRYRPLWWAIRGDGSLRITEMLLKAGANPNLWLSESSSESALGMALWLHSNDKQSLKYARLLASYGADLSQPVKTDGTSLFSAALRSRFEPASELLQELINLGAKFPEKSGENLFFLALFTRDPAVLKILQTGGIDCTAVDQKGKTFLHLMLELNNISDSSARYYQYAEFVPKVINLPDNEGKTPLHYAVNSNEPGLVETLLKWKADSQKQDKNGDSPRSLAEKMHYMRLLKIIDSTPANQSGDIH